MKTLIIMISFLITNLIFSNELDCIERAEKLILSKVAKELNVFPSQLKVRYIGGESFDGDSTGDGRYMDHAGEYFDLFLSSEDPNIDEALSMFSIEIFTFRKENSDQVLSCEFDNLSPVAPHYWQEVYYTYL